MRVGTSSAFLGSDPTSTDHPHACGDKLTACKLCIKQRVSSPCVWGQVHAYIMVDVLCRIIPMRVGTRQSQYYTTQAIEDHPHACGDKAGSWKTSGIREGSSPCVWGQAPCDAKCVIVRRIIPMRVGTRYNFNPILIDAEDHPHACGGKTTFFAHYLINRGSSPCVWGQG